jgi:RNA polymerase-binding protein DksA
MALNPSEMRELMDLVDRRRAALRSEVNRDLDRVRQDDLDHIVGAVPDPGDESVQSLIQDLDQADASRGLSELRMLDAARSRIEEGSYGVCAQCGQDIGFERLRANPGALRCIQCQTQFEKTHAGATRPTL